MESRRVKLKKSADVRTLSKDVWIVEKEGVSRARSQRTNGRYATQAEAKTAAKDAVERNGGAEVIVHGRDGTIRDSDTISGRDPYPPHRRTKH